jgi:signal transduction histidine kinase
MNYEVTRLSLENEMDLVLGHKRSIRLGELLNLSVSSQTAFTTAISECCREVIEKTGSGLLIVEIAKEDNKFFLKATIRYKDPGPGNLKPSRYNPLDYAKKLVSHFVVYIDDLLNHIELRVNIPQSRRLTEEKITEIIEYFRNESPSTPYEQVKRKKEELNKIASEQEEQLIRSQYVNEKKTEFLSIASHELKTPLTTIKAFTQLALAEGEGCSETVRIYLNKINLQSDKLNKLIQQLLDVSKVEAGQLDLSMEEVSMNGYIHDTVSLLSKSIPTNPIQVELKDNVMASIDKLRVEQVFANILVNAAKYSKERTPIRITTAVEPGKLLRVSIRDEGIGMSKQNIQRVFEKFFRAEEIARSYSGLGMGLYIASKIVTTHGGRIWIDSELDIGSTFHFTLPYLYIAAPSLQSG